MTLRAPRAHWLGACLLVAAALACGFLLANATGTGGATSPVTKVAACAPPAPGTHRVPVAANRIPVVLHVPPGVPPAGGRRPLVLVLPGAGQSASAIASYTGYSKLADMRGFLVAYPTATGNPTYWNISGQEPERIDDVAYLRSVIRKMSGPAACADPQRVSVTGVSNGGGMAARLGCESADLLAAVAPVAGGYSSLPKCKPGRPLPLLEIHGLRDGVVPYNGKGPTHAGALGPFLAGWRSRDGCTTASTRTWPAHNVLEFRWHCAQGRQIVHDRVYDAEHGWPGGSSLTPFSSTLRTWEFLSAFRAPVQAR